MNETFGDEWLATYHEGDSRLQNRRHGILRINIEKSRLEFAVQTKEAENAPFILVSYPIQYLLAINKVERRKKLKKYEFLEFTFDNTPNAIKPLFSFNLVEIDTISSKILRFQEDSKQTIEDKESSQEPDIVKALSTLLMKPVEQLQHLFDDVTSQLRFLTKKPKSFGTKILKTLDPPPEYETQEVSLHNRVVRYYQSTNKFESTFIMLSPLGGKLEDLFPMNKILTKSNFNVVYLGIRGFTSPVEQDTEFKLKNYIEDIKHTIEFLAPNKKVILGAHSLMSAVIFDEFMKEEYENIEKFVILSGLHRAPKTFRNGVKALPPVKLWGPFKGQVKKMAPKVLFAKSCPSEIAQSYVKEAFTIPDKVYSNIFRDFLPKFDYLAMLEGIKKPLLALWGKEDQLIPVELREEMIGILPREYFYHKTFPGGHMFPYESPVQVGQEITKFIYTKRSRIYIE
ncbi:MAG: alpha/beta hydrolase [Candidatus Hodarchaeales archaeon]|jgi:hypothetical protein